MYIHAIACSLPDGKSFFTFHSHIDESKCVWKPSDRDGYFSILDKVREVYRNPQGVEGLKPNQLSMFKPEGVSLEEALMRVAPYRVTADRATKNTQFLTKSLDDVNTVSVAGVGEHNGLDFYVLVKQAEEFKPTGNLLKWALSTQVRKGSQVRARNSNGDLLPIEAWQPGMDVMVDKHELDINDPVFRSYTMLVSVVRARSAAGDKLVHEGRLKIVAVPNEVEVDLVRTRNGEMLREKARTWS